MTNGITVMSGELGDIFWDLAPWITYDPGYDLGSSIYVANPTDTEKEYALMARISREALVISEEVLPVFGHSWIKVSPGAFIRLKGALRFAQDDVELAILMIERETEEVSDSVITVLVSPSTAGVLPPAWPGGTTTSGFDWSTMLAMMLPIMMLGVVTTATKPDEKKEKETAPQAAEPVKLLPEGRET